jgi:TatD DNase family protein
MLVDSHCHLNFPEFKQDLDQAIERARSQGISYMLTVNTRLSESLDIQRIADAYPNIFCSVGVHPHDSKDYNEPALIEQLKAHAAHPKVVALGETGLDYYYNKSDQAAQIDCFNMHLNTGVELNLPVIIHTREADADTISCLDRGLYISFSGIITFKNASDLREVVKFVPLDRLLVETDSPFLAPLPHRGRRNEPAFTYFVAKMVAELKGLSLEEVAESTTKNFFRLFNKATP